MEGYSSTIRRRIAGRKCAPGSSARSVARPLTITRPRVPDGTLTSDATMMMKIRKPIIGMTRTSRMIQAMVLIRVVPPCGRRM